MKNPNENAPTKPPHHEVAPREESPVPNVLPTHDIALKAKLH